MGRNNRLDDAEGVEVPTAYVALAVDLAHKRFLTRILCLPSFVLAREVSSCQSGAVSVYKSTRVPVLSHPLYITTSNPYRLHTGINSLSIDRATTISIHLPPPESKITY